MCSNLLSDSAYRFARYVVEARLGRRLWALLVLSGVTVLALLRTARQLTLTHIFHQRSLVSLISLLALHSPRTPTYSVQLAL